MDQERSSYDWYSHKAIYDWYAPNLPQSGVQEAQSSPAQQPPKPRRKRTGMKVTMIVVCVLILVAATALAFSDGFDRNWDFDYSISLPGSEMENDNDGEKPATDSDVPEGFFDNIPGFSDMIPDSGNNGNTEDLPDDFREFFDSYYTMEESILPSNLPRAATGDKVTLELESAEELDELSLQQLYSRCSPSVVGVIAGYEGESGYGWGTGVIMDAAGYVITNAHVISEADTCTVVLWNGRECEALLVGEDAQSDLAVLKIEAKGLVPASFGNSDELVVGDEVVAIGNPLGAEFSGTLTNGIVSAINRNVDYSGTNLTLIQTNAALNEGNSGGPLINMYGQVIGITNMKMVNTYGSATIEGIGFAIPSTTVKQVADQIIANGKVTGRPGIGITCGSVPEEAMTEYGLPAGLYITEVSEGSDAKAKGIQPGDVLTHINGIQVLTTDDVLTIRDEHEVGDVLVFTIYRDGRTFDVEVEIYDLSNIY